MNKISNLFFQVPLQEQVLFARHLSVMVRAGLPLLQSLKMIQKETESKAMTKILDQAISDVSNGQYLSASLEKFKGVFGNLFINIIRVGESAGILSENLTYLAEELKKKRELRRKVIGSLIYPFIILIATLGISGLLTVFIFPKILPVFRSLNVELPLTTKILIAISNILTDYGLLTIGIFLAMLLGLWLATRNAKIKFYLHRAFLLLPIFGKIVRDVNLSNFTRTLGLTLKSGVKVIEAINITAESLPNLVYRGQLLKIAESARAGEALAPQFAEMRQFFPGILSQMIAAGESAGNLSETLLYLSDFYESEVSESTKNLSNVLEPILMVLMGLIVGFVAISIITPIYEVTSTIGRR